jgi:hypothetical protein
MDPGRPWASTRITEDKQTMVFFSSSVYFHLGNGETFLFWSSPWLDGNCLSELAPEVMSTVPVRRQKQWIVAHALANMSWTSDVTGALTVQVLL